ncbi:hypothetical protein A0H81_13106 [Grifola frondosa]|uniref:DUF6535 domain-containing protein n=1 Tax=Grifola frondosa TaxID=5627 RepID=A0A1C7LR61_GRIFR|nr:hypothetical protein A0H81_13106 [Grifola frondosa]
MSASVEAASSSNVTDRVEEGSMLVSAPPPSEASLQLLPNNDPLLTSDETAQNRHSQDGDNVERLKHEDLTSPTKTREDIFVQTLPKHEWKEEIDTLLVFAGLFSAVLTAFNIQSYVLLQANSADTSNLLLAQISAQLNSFVVNNAFINSTQPLLSTAPAFRPSVYAVVINALWFSSLIFSLAAAFIGILVKQWLNRYTRGISIVSREAARVRQFRHDALMKYGVINIMALLPVLLQIALILFLAGLLVLVWSLHRVVAAIATALVGMLLVFLVITTILPTIAADCPYQSPQAWGLLVMMQTLRFIFRGTIMVVTSYLSSTKLLEEFGPYAVLFRRISQSWRTRERSLIRKSQSALDWHVLAAADAVTIDDGFLKSSIRPCIADIQVDVPAATTYFYNILQGRMDAASESPLWHLTVVETESNRSLVELALEIFFKASYEQKPMTKLKSYIKHQAQYASDDVLIGLCGQISLREQDDKARNVLFQTLFDLFQTDTSCITPRHRAGRDGIKAVVSLIPRILEEGHFVRYLHVCNVMSNLAVNSDSGDDKGLLRAAFTTFIRVLADPKIKIDPVDLVLHLSIILSNVETMTCSTSSAIIFSIDAINTLDGIAQKASYCTVAQSDWELFLRSGLKLRHTIRILRERATRPAPGGWSAEGLLGRFPKDNSRPSSPRDRGWRIVRSPTHALQRLRKGSARRKDGIARTKVTAVGRDALKYPQLTVRPMDGDQETRKSSCSKTMLN